jgi:hypothetical protein
MAPTKATKVATVEKTRREKGKKSKKATTPPPPGEPIYDDNGDLLVDGQFEPTAGGSGLNERGGGDESAGRHGDAEGKSEEDSTSDNDEGEGSKSLMVKKGKKRAKKSKKARRRARVA